MFADIVGAENCITDPAGLRVYECDGLTGTRVRPAAVVLPATTDEVARCIVRAGELGMAIVPRGSGTGLSGGALPIVGALVIGMSRMRAILDVDLENQRMRVQPGVINLDISKHLAPLGYYYAPDPSSQSVCSIGGNVAENSGGAHCLKYGFTINHVVALTMVLASGEVVEIGSPVADPLGYDLTSAVIGSEGLLGIVTEVVVRFLRKPQATRTVFATFPSTDEAGEAVSQIISAGIVPAAIEMMDALAIEAIVASTHVDWPLDVGAALLMDVDGIAAEVEETADAAVAILQRIGAVEIRNPHDESERALMWKGRKGAFAAMGRISPNYYVQDGVIPRSDIARVLRYDARSGDESERAEHVASEILQICIKYGGSITGEHGVGADKAAYMGEMFNDDDLETMHYVRCAFDATRTFNPTKVFPAPRICGDRAGVR